MKKIENGYVAPQMEVVAAVVECGFSISNGGVDDASIGKYEVVDDVEW